MSVLVCPVCREHVLLLLIGRSQLVNYNFELHSCVGDGQWMLWTAVCPSSRSYSRRYGSRTAAYNFLLRQVPKLVTLE